jgi:hypothetical protein
MPHARLSCDQSLDYKIVNSRLQRFNIMTFPGDGLPDGLKRPFVAVASAFSTLILLIIRRILIDSIVGQVHIHIIQVTTVWLLIRTGCKSS